MSPQLTVHNAQLSTATVQINTLTISGKQLTLAVFRQLREEPLLSDEGTLRGIPWGAVNYHPDKCADADEHLHVVWQEGDQLHRARVDAPRHTYFLAEDAYEFIQAGCCLNAHGNLDEWRRYKWNDGRMRGSGIRFEVDGMNCETAGEPLRRVAFGINPADHKCRTQEDYEKHLQWLREDIAQERERRARVDAHWKAFGDLPQLFIAV